MRFALAFAVPLMLAAICLSAQPPLGWTTECKVVRVVDGDTVDVAITKVIRVRLLDCWAPETSTPEGKRASAAMHEKAGGKEAVVFLPGSMATMNILSLNRVLGHVWVNGESLSEWQVQSGRATKTKVARRQE